MKKNFILFFLLSFFHLFILAQNTPEYNVKIENFKFVENYSNAYYKGILLQFDYDLFCRQQGKDVQLTIVPKFIDEKNTELLLPEVALLKENIKSKQFFNKHYYRKNAEIFIPYVALKKYYQSRILEIQLFYKIADKSLIKTFSQNVNFKIPVVKAIKPNAQEIQVENCSANHHFHPVQKVSGLQIKLKCNFKYAFDEIIGSDTNSKNATCILVPKLLMQNKIIFPQNPKQEIQYEMMPLRTAGKPDVYTQTVEFFIPYHHITGDGSFKALLVPEFYDAKKAFQFPVGFKKDVEINKSTIIQYQHQEFSVKKLDIINDVMNDSQHGMLVNVEVIPKYIISQIAGADTNADLQNYYFYVELFNAQKQKVFPDLKLTPLSFTVLRKALRPISKSAPYKLQLFIPYRSINVAEGLQTLQLTLNAENNSKTITFADIARQTFTYNQPTRYLMTVEVNNLTVPEGNYDVSGQNIPILNLFIGNKSKAGKGKADLFWTIETGTERLFSSGVAKNSLVAIDDKARVIITDKDKIKLKAFDQDILSFDDFIGEVEIVHKIGEDVAALNAVTANGISNVNLRMQKNIFPVLKHYRFEIQNPFVYAGISGVAFDFEFVFNAISKSDTIVIKPIMLKDSLFNIVQDFYILEQNFGTSNLIVNAGQSAGKLKLFIPYWKLQDACQIGLQLYCVNQNFVLTNFISPNFIYLPKINDVKVNLKLNTEAMEDDFTGLRVVAENSLPAHYLTDKGLQQVTFTWSLLLRSSNAEKDNSYSNDINAFQTSFFPDAPQFSKSIFVPYYLIKNLRGRQDLVFRQTARITGTNIIIGEYVENVTVDFPELLQVQIQELRLQLQKMKKTKKVYFEVYHGKNMVYRSDTLKNGKEIVWNTLNSNVFTLHTNDVVSLYLFGKDKRNRETLSYIWAYKGKDFYRMENNFVLNNTTFMKNGKISFFTVKK